MESLARADSLRALGPYRELAWIAQGPVAQVYRAWDSRRQEWVALKVLAPAFTPHDPDGRHLREASAAARTVRHPHLLPLLDAGAHDGRLYLAMPYMAGGTLAQPLPAARTVGQLLRLLYQVCQALAQAHQQAPPLVHGNLKPSNLLLPRAEYILVAELGVAASLPLDLAARARRGLLGTLTYTAPELALHGAASPQADIYALGVVLFELLTGRLPFEGPTPLAVLYGHALAPVPPAGALNPTLTPAWEAVLQRALAKEPAARYPSVDALYAALYAAYQGLGGACVRLPDPPKGPRVAAAPAPPVGPDAVALAAALRRQAPASPLLDVLLDRARAESAGGAGAGPGAEAAGEAPAAPPEEVERRLAGWYAYGLAALRDGDMLRAADAFATIVRCRPDYRDALPRYTAALAAADREQLRAALRMEQASAPPVASAREPVEPAAPPRDDAAVPRLAMSRPAVLAALYQQGVQALRRGDYLGAETALAPVVREAAAQYPDAATHLAAARLALAPGAAPSAPAATSAAPGTRGRGWPRGWWLLATVLVGLLALGALLLARR